jgi:phage-related minor tail protein
MAGYIKGITIEFGANTTKLNKALNNVNGKLNKTQAELKQVNRALKFNPGNTTLLKQKFDLLQKTVTQTQKKLQGLKAMQRKLDASGVDKNSAQYRQLQREIIKTEDQLKKAQNELKRFGSVGKQQVQAVGNAFKTVGGKISAAGRSITTSVSVYGMAAIYAGKKLIDMSLKQSEAEQKLTEIYKSRMGVGKKAVKSTLKLASAQQKVGVVGDEVQLAGAQQLATYAQYPSTVNKLLPSLNDLLVQQKGLNGTQEDATALANLFGKAMMGQTGALKKAGISFTEEQEKVLKYGTEEEKAAMLAEVVKQNVGDMNEEFAKTDAGKIQQAKNELGDMGEQIGAILLPAVADLVSWFQDNLLPKIQQFIDFMKQHPQIAKFALAFAAIMAVAGPVLMIFGGIVSAIGVLIPVFAALAGPIGLVVAAIAAAVAIGIALYNNWDTIKAKASEVWGNVRDAVSVVVNQVKNNFNTLKTNVTNVWNGIKNAITKPIETAKNVVSKAIQKIKGFFPLKIGKIFSGMKLPHFSVKGSPPFGIGGKGTKPGISVKWYKKAMQEPYMFSNATLFGAGESGDEMLYGRNSLLNDIATASGSGEVVSRLAAIEAILDYYLPKGQQIVMDNGALIGQVNRGLGLKL